ncbi:hypothetical protein S40293_09878 [Stachybotrys chartarum IBT 40293]|nr:hypothetical protein S40293_09878 [Stachybotrys chartarum IBT 40293]
MPSPTTERKLIHFNEQVEQCIAINAKGVEAEEVVTDRLADYSGSDGAMRNRKHYKNRLPVSRRRTKNSVPPEGKTIAMLSSTTLKYREDTFKTPETAIKHSTGVSRSLLMPPSSSQETVRPTKRSKLFFIYEDGDGDDDLDYSIPSSTPASVSQQSESTSSGLHRSVSSSSLGDESSGMCRIAPGMLEEDGSSAGDGFFGRVTETVNTARDITYIFWNVGWRT